MTVTFLIIIITALISWQAFSRPDLIKRFRHFPYAEKRANQYYRLLTAGFLHANMMHLLINMFVFWSFGTYVEMKYQSMFGASTGRIYFLLVYVATIFLANIPTYLNRQDDYSFASIGASGAVSGIVFISVLFEPWSMIYLFAIIPIPGIVAGVLFLIYSTWAGRQGKDMIDHSGHFYGAITGLVLTIILNPGLLNEFINKLADVPSFSGVF